MVAPEGSVLTIRAPVPPGLVTVGTTVVAVGTVAVAVVVVVVVPVVVPVVVGTMVGNAVGILFMKMMSGTLLCSPGLSVTVVVYSLYPW
jgi:hypothetical protein